jgi:hypothetical protein
MAAVYWTSREQMNHLLFIEIVTQYLRKMLFDRVLSTEVPLNLPIADFSRALWLVSFVRDIKS